MEVRQINQAEEIRGFGPMWGCSRFGFTGHDYFDCPECQRLFKERMTRLGEELK
jgi:hypothetical protein